MIRSITQYLKQFSPPALHIPARESLRASLGALLGLMLASLLCTAYFGSSVTLHLLGPLAASAVLLFAVHSGALAQPWSIVGSYLVATVVALLMAHFFGRSLPVACAAVGLSLLIMCPLRCLHPPGGAVAMCLMLSDSTLSGMGAWVLEPVMLNAGSLLAVALVYNNMTGVRYPKAHGPAPASAPVPASGITDEDMDHALDEIGEFVDITREDLEAIILATEKHAARRRLAELEVRSAGSSAATSPGRPVRPRATPRKPAAKSEYPVHGNKRDKSGS
ncbi:hypothetical protein GUY40_14200 [Pseudomonas sp. R5(2019)]|nr:hypothetical protein [Pseudomonas sp. R5(2019)]